MMHERYNAVSLPVLTSGDLYCPRTSLITRVTKMCEKNMTSLFLYNRIVTLLVAPHLTGIRRNNN